MSFDIGCTVKIDKCTVCPAIVGKTAKVKGFIVGVDETERDKVELNFGRGRPPSDRPSVVDASDVSLVGESES